MPQATIKPVTVNAYGAKSRGNEVRPYVDNKSAPSGASTPISSRTTWRRYRRGARMSARISRKMLTRSSRYVYDA